MVSEDQVYFEEDPGQGKCSSKPLKRKQLEEVLKSKKKRQDIREPQFEIKFEE